MNKIGTVSDVKGDVARVTLHDMDNVVTDWLPINTMQSITCSLGGKCTVRLNISIGDEVVVSFYNDNLKDGAIVAKVG